MSSNKDDDDKNWKLEDLAERVGVSPRTVRYYVQRGLLPAPTFRGKDTVYTADHLARLQTIRKLQERFLPLDQIQAMLARGPIDHVAAVADALPAPARAAPHIPMVPWPEPKPRPTSWERWTLAPGLELNIAEDANPAVRALFEKLRRIADGGTKV